MPNKITIKRPNDFHVHLREGSILKSVLPFTANVFHHAVLMPNLTNPLTSIALIKEYKQFVEEELKRINNKTFIPLFTLYLTNETELDELKEGYKNNDFFAVKLYPSGVTTNSSSGITNFDSLYPVFESMEKLNIPLLIHGEDPSCETDIFDKESVFIEKTLIPIRKRFQNLRITLEHITTKSAVEYILSEYSEQKPLKSAATITPHHLHINRSDIFAVGLNPHYYCMPIAKREEHRKAVIKAAVSGLPPFFLGTDSAPHLKSCKESSLSPAGIFNTPNALGLYAQIFDEEEKLDSFEAFASVNGAAFYGLPVSDETITLIKEEKSQDVKPILTEDMKELAAFISPKPVFWKLETN